LVFSVGIRGLWNTQ